MKDHIIQVSLPILQNKSVFDYISPEKLEIGDIVKVQFRKEELLGVVLHLRGSGEVDVSKIKHIIAKIPEIKISHDHIKFIEFVAKYNMAKLGAVLKFVIPFADVPKPNSCQPALRTQFDMPLLNDSQADALKAMQKHIAANPFSVSVIDGVTGSGKTEVYSHLIADILRENSGQVLVLFPEIMLTNQFLNRFTERFAFSPGVWHSNISIAEKKKLWRSIIDGNTRFVIGARSALFLPFKDLKLIVIDEEHDSSYKQEDGVIYNARDMAIAYGYIHKIPVILSSATPSLETINNINTGRYFQAKLDSRYHATTLPKISIVNMRSIKQNKSSKWLSDEIISKATQALSLRHQVLFFLNRKGYAPITICRTCGNRTSCPDCSACMVFHKSKMAYVCHQCGYTLGYSVDCKACGTADSLISCGPGVERIEEDVRKIWPDKEIVSITRDSMLEDDAESILQGIHDKKIDIIIGTQVLSKGYDFQNLNLVCVIDADIGLMGADLRATEKTYQLLTQVSGRAGRLNQGEVVIQTFYPENQLLRALQQNDRQGFYNLELQMRESSKMPPFGRLAAVIFSGTNEEKLIDFTKKLSAMAPFSKSITLLGPAPAPITKIRKRYRYRFLLKAGSKVNIQQYLDSWLGSAQIPSTIRIKIDIDPYNFL